MSPTRSFRSFWSDQYDVNLEYRGHASGEDRAVWRGDRDGMSFSVFYLRDGLIDAVLSMNDSKTNELGGKLIESRRLISESALSKRRRRSDRARPGRGTLRGPNWNFAPCGAFGSWLGLGWDSFGRSHGRASPSAASGSRPARR